ncbi:MAG: sodium/solute symporter [Chitinophagaceae bacterium]
MKKHNAVIRRAMILLLMIFTILESKTVSGQIQHQLKWENLPPIPNKVGFAGMFAGVSNGALICMGGANFPDKMPWEGGIKQWHNQIFILEEGAESWIISKSKLPSELAYGASFTYKNDIVIVGGSDGQQNYSDVYALSYAKGEVKIKKYPTLPFPLANITGALVGDILFIAGGNSKFAKSGGEQPGNYFLALDLAHSAAKQKWVELKSWPGPPRIMAVSASLKGDFFLFSGMNTIKKTDGTTEEIILKDAYKFTPKYIGKYLEGGLWSKLSEMPRGVGGGASPAPTIGSEHIIFPGGLDEVTAKHSNPETFPGFATDLLAYHSASNSWLNLGHLPQSDTRATLPTAKWGDRWVIPNGEVGPGKRSSSVFTLSKNLSFGWINWLALILYLIFMIVIGVIFDKKNQTTKSFFTGNGKIPWWATGVSIFGAQFSAISFMAVPAIVYATNWTLAIGSLMILAPIPLVVKYFIPVIRKLSVTSAYEYLEARFNANVRLFGSVSFIIFQLARFGVVLFLPALAITSVTGINIYLIILIMGIICVIYTVMGGIEAVIWTDVAQVIILMGGAILCLVIGISNLEGNIWLEINQGIADQKFALFEPGWSSERLVLWVVIVGFFFLQVIPFTSDQTVIQRYFTVIDNRSVAKSLWTHALISIPAIPIFMGLGTVLYFYYKNNSSSISAEKVDEILPYFIVQELPVGISGLIIAGIFAASQSSLSASMNSIAASFVSDIDPRFRKKRTDIENLNLAKLVTLTVGLFGIISAMLIAFLKIEFIFNLFQEIVGILCGALSGTFILGVLTKRANSTGVIFGMIIGTIAVLLVKYFTNTNVFLYGAVSIVTTILTGYLISLFNKGRESE